MATTIVEPEIVREPPREPPREPTRKPARQPIRPSTFHVVDVGVLAGSVISSQALSWLLYYRLAPFSGLQGYLFVWFVLFEVMYFLANRELEGNALAKDKAISAGIAVVAVGIIVPLASILGYTIWRGVKAFTFGFFVHDLRFVGPQDAAAAGGGLHSIIGTLEQVALAAVVCVPLGVLTAVFLNEVGGPLARPVRTFVDAMSGVPSIVAGLFIYAVFIVTFGFGFSGAMAALALSILMLPTVTRTTEVVLRLVPGGLREASLALGAPEWKTALRVVLPTAKAGVVTAVILGIARIVGETAPLIMTSLGSSVVNANPFHGPQDSLPLFTWNLIRSPYDAQIDRAWTGAFVLILIVLLLFVIARVIGGRGVGTPSRRARRRARKETA